MIFVGGNMVTAHRVSYETCKQFECRRGLLLLQRPSPGVLIGAISGYDDGEIADHFIREVDDELASAGRLRLFADLRAQVGIDVKARERGTEWLRDHQHQDLMSEVLVGSKVMSMALGVMRIFSNAGDKVVTHCDPWEFEQSILRVVPNYARR
jgi:hypothetical protein